MSVYQNLIRPLLFRLPAEDASHLAALTLRLWPIWGALRAVNGFESPDLSTEIAGIPIGNPVGLAAGLDKDCEILPALSRLGFGYLTCGTVTLDPRPGNPKPRLIRDQGRDELINSMGFPNKGLASAVEKIERDRHRCGDTPIVVSVSGTEVDDIVECHRKVEPLAHAVEVNISSPNTKGLRIFHSPHVLGSLLGAIDAGRSKPLFVKIPPFPSEGEDAESHDSALSLVDVCLSNRVDALTVANTHPVNDARLAAGSGGLSGKPVYEPMLRMVSEVRQRVGDGTCINASGGIFTAQDAWAAIEAGANTVQALTGLVYRGPNVARDIAKGLAELVERRGIEGIAQLRYDGMIRL